MKPQLEEPAIFSTDASGNIGRVGGWLLQSIREVGDANSALPISLAELVNATNPDYRAAVYFYDSFGDLMTCASLNKDDDASAAIFNDMVNDILQPARVEKDTSSGSKSGMLVAAHAIVAAGITATFHFLFD